MKKTKIVATISSKNCEVSFLRKLHAAGMNVVRLNTAHLVFEDTAMLIRNIREVSDLIAIMIDTKGPEIRTTKAEKPVELKTGDIIAIQGDPSKDFSSDCIYVSYSGIVHDVPVHSHILIDDGSLELYVTDKKNGRLICEVKNDGLVENHKSINVPGVGFNLPSLSQKDRDFIQFAIEQDVDFIAHSFVRNKEDIIDIQKILDKHKSPIKIIAKIENQEGVDNIDEIVDHAYGIMVARGDLAIEIPYEKIPNIQRMLINKCINSRKPVIIATQMLHSMIKSPRPTRAEVSDVANSIYSKTDAIMLSGETAYGPYALEAVKTMAKVAIEAEKSHLEMHDVPTVVLTNERSAYLTKTAVEAAINLNAKAILSDSSTGSSIRNMAGFRGRKPIFAYCYDKHVVRQLALSFGVFAEYLDKTRNSHEFVHKALVKQLENKRLKEDDLVVVMAGNFGDKFGASFIEISPAKLLMNRY